MLLFAIGVWSVYVVSQLNFTQQDANFDLANYHAYVPSALLNGTWFSDIHPALTQSYLTPYQDLLMWPVISMLPAPMAVTLIVALQLSIFIPLGLILHTVVPAISRARALGIGLVAISGAMAMSELGTTFGDIPPAILGAWALYSVLSVLAGQAGRPGRRVVLAGALLGIGLALKYTLVFIGPGVLMLAAFLLFAGMRRSAALFLLSCAVAFVLLSAPWALVLQLDYGSPIYPFYNSIFHAPRYPAVSYHDDRFGVGSIKALIRLPLLQAQGAAYTVEMPFKDARWAIAAVVAVLAVLTAAARSFRPSVGFRSRAELPGLALLMFWGVSYATWAYLFGIQRYVVLLEVLAVPVIVVGAALILPRLIANAASVALLVWLVVFLAGNTTTVDFGRRPMSWQPIFPSQTIEPLTHYDSILVAQPALSYMRAVTRDAPGSSHQIWFSTPFNHADADFVAKAVTGRSVGVIFYSEHRDEAVSASAGIGLLLTDECALIDSPLANIDLPGTIEVCSATPLP
jgi:hypothetical protein